MPAVSLDGNHVYAPNALDSMPVGIHPHIVRDKVKHSQFSRCLT